MAFITPASSKPEHPGRRLARWLAALVLLPLLWLCTPSAWADGFTIREASTQMQQGVYRLSARLDYRLSGEVLEAIENGVPLTVQLEIEVQRKRRWWLDETVATLTQRYRLYFHALSHQYMLRNLNSNALYAYPTLVSALIGLGRVDGLPLLDNSFIEEGENYEVQLRSHLDIEALPSPLRPLAYITPEWHLSSDWFSCSLTP